MLRTRDKILRTLVIVMLVFMYASVAVGFLYFHDLLKGTP